MKYLFLLIFWVTLVSCQKQENSPQAGVMESVQLKGKELGGDFQLSSKSGPWSLKDSNGKLRVIYFGFTYCPDICPTSLQKLSKALKELSPAERKKVQPVFISVDYKRDNPKVCQEYVDYFFKDGIGLSGDKNQIDKVTKMYGVYYKFAEVKDSELDYNVDHTSRFYLIDQKGRFVDAFSSIKDNPEFIKTIKQYL